MHLTTFSQSSILPLSVEELFAWHGRPGAFARLNPPWDPVKVVEATGGIQDGAKVHIKIPFGPLNISWYLGHKDYIANKQFRDYQIRGPFKSWEHTHTFSAASEESSKLSDEISYQLPLSPLSDIFAGAFIKSKLSRLFEYRHRITKNDLNIISRYRDLLPPGQRILVSGSTGFVGSALCAFLSCAGHDITILTRKPPKNDKEIFWDPEKKELNSELIEGFDYIIHLAGENVAQRWTPKVKARILDSRVNSTKLLTDAIVKIKQKPKAFLCASAIGYYGDCGDSKLDESSSLGKGFLAEVCRQWEQATQEASRTGVRTVNFRVGVVLSPQAGALAKMLLPFNLGLGGPMGAGSHYMSCMALDDVLYALYHCMAKDIHGPVNFTGPEPVTNETFSKTLGKVLKRPTIFTTPAFALRLVYKDLVDEALLASIRVVPTKLINSGFTFTFGDLESCLKHFL